MMVRSSWVESDGDYYFVNSAGQKITNDWRLTTPYDDEDAEEQWFYFQSTGKRAENKKLVIKGKTYFFDADGNMLTGWVQKNGDEYEQGENDITSGDGGNAGSTYYCDETGARLEKTWVETWAPEVDDEDADTDDLHYYYLKSSGTVQTGKASNINGQTYFFGTNGQMLTGWIAKTSSNYEMIWEHDADTDGKYDDSLSSSALAGADIYFCAEDGHMRKNKWAKMWNNKEFGMEDDDNDEYWFYLEKSGKVYVPTSGDAVNKYKFIDGEGESFSGIFENKGQINVTEKKINGKTYLFDTNGQMVSGFIMRGDKDAIKDGKGLMYYYGGSNDGVMAEGSKSISDDSGVDYRFYFSNSNGKDGEYYYNGAGVNGNKNGKLYKNGLLVKAMNDKYEVADVTIYDKDGTVVGTEDYHYIINQSGSIQTSDKKYEEDDDVLIDATKATFDKSKGALKGSVKNYVEN